MTKNLIRGAENAKIIREADVRMYLFMRGMAYDIYGGTFLAIFVCE